MTTEKTDAQTLSGEKGQLPVSFGADDKGQSFKLKEGKDALGAEEGATKDNTGAQDKVGKVDESTTTQTPLPETILKTEHEKLLKSIRDGHTGTVSQMRTDREALDTKIEELEDKLEERGYDNWLKLLEEKGGVENLDLAKQVVERDRDTRKQLRELERERRKLTSLKSELDEAGKGKGAYDFAKEFGLDEAVIPQLLATGNVLEMRVKAQELYIEKLKTAATPVEKPDPGEGSTKGLDISKLSLTTRIGLAAEQKI